MRPAGDRSSGSADVFVARVRSGDRLPDDQAEVVFTDEFVEQLEAFEHDQKVAVLADVVRLCEDPAGSHPLHAPLAGWNTLETLNRKHRVIYRAHIATGVGVIDVLCIGPRSKSEVYDVVEGLMDSGLLTEDELTQIWNALALLDVTAREVGLNDWDYQPPPAPEGMRKAAVAAGALPMDVASVLSKDELEAALEAAWGDDGLVDVERAIAAALARHSTAQVHPDEVLGARSGPRCGAFMPRARSACARREGHPGPHRAR